MDNSAVGRNKKNISWTPLMDRYFINLMIKEVQRGAKVDNAFVKNGWSRMERLFQQKFGTIYNKDCMRNRLKTLKKQYNIIKSLCEQSWIVWNHESQMIVVNDETAWEAYIKDHPEAQNYRHKQMAYYEDLCVAFSRIPVDGKVNSVGNSSGAKTIMCEEEALEAATDLQSSPVSDAHEYLLDDGHGSQSSKSGSEGTESPATTSHDRKKMYWTPVMDHYFISLMVEEVRKGTKVDNTFNKHGWNRMERAFQQRFGTHFHRDYLRNRLKTLRKQYNVIKSACEHRGFGWNRETQMITATDESLWDEYTKEHPEARPYKDKPLPFFEELCAVFSRTVADGRYSIAGASFRNKDGIPSMDGMEAAVDPLSSPISTGHEHAANGLQDSSDSGEDKDIRSKRRKRRSMTPHSLDHSRKSQIAGDDVVKALRQMAAAVNSLANAFKEVKNSQLVEKYMSALSEIPGMDPDLFLAACDLLEDEKKAKTFLALNVELRKRWLMKKLRPF
ncbi:unnamed protein product [Victoria cruziana]